MSLPDVGSTSKTLLREAADWENHFAWVTLRNRYDPLLRCHCRRYGLDNDAIDEVCQLIWIELAHRMKNLCYDPRGSFRVLLKLVCHWRALDFLRRRRATCFLSLDDRDDELEVDQPTRGVGSSEPADGDGVAEVFRFYLIAEAERAQAAVRAKVNHRTWDAFWLVAVQGCTVEETAQVLEMTRVAVYAARARVARMLEDEGKRILGRSFAGA